MSRRSMVGEVIIEEEVMNKMDDLNQMVYSLHFTLFYFT